MFKRLLPKEVNFFEYFKKHSELVVDSSDRFIALCNSTNNMDMIIHEIKDLETRADEIVHICHDDLNSTFITPLDRSDIHSLIKKMDDIIDCINSTSSRIEIYNIQEIRPEAKKLSEIIKKATSLLCDSLHMLEDKKRYSEIVKACVGIHYLESQGDEIIKDALRSLFNETNPVTIIKWKEIFERLERSLDRCDDVANILEKIIIEAS